MAIKPAPFAEELNQRFPVLEPDNSPDAKIVGAAISLVATAPRSRRHKREEDSLMLVLVVSAAQRALTLRQVSGWLKRQGCNREAEDLLRLLTDL